MNCKQCGEEMNPIDAVLSSTNGVCGSCTRKNQKIVFIDHCTNKAQINSLYGKFKED